MRSTRRPNWMSRRMVLRAPIVVQLPRIRKSSFCFLFGGLITWTALTYLCLSKILPSVPTMFSDEKGTHLHGRSAGISSNPSNDIPIDMFAPLNMVNNEPPKEMKASNKYLFPILLGNQGLNNQLIGFKMSVVVAMYTNRTLVLAPFFDKQRQALRVRDISEVMDLEHLKELLPTISMTEFKKQCEGKIETLFSGINMSNALKTEQYNEYLRSVNAKVRLSKNLTGIEVRDFEKEPGILVELPGNLPDGQHSLKTFRAKGLFESESKCAGVVYPYGLMVRFYYYDYVPVFAQYLRRPPEIRQMADSFIWEVINSRNFLGIHWRFDDAWKLTWCKNGVLDQKVQQNCNILLTSDEKSMVARIVDIMKEHSISSAYLSSPPTSQDKFIIELKKEVPNVYNRYDLLGISILGLDFDLDDNFRLSLLEQEICSKSALFIGSRMSAWTDIVAEDRNYKNRLYMPDIFKASSR